MRKHIILWTLVLFCLAVPVLGVSINDNPQYFTNDDADVSGSTLIDDAGTQNGTLTNTNSNTGIINEAREYDGTNDQADTNRADSTFQDHDIWSISVWAYSDTQSAQRGVIGNLDGSNNGISIKQFDYGGTYRWAFWHGSREDLGVVVQDETWQHIVMTNDGTNQKFYINGVSVYNTTQTWTDSGLTMNLGNVYESAYTTTRWDGRIDEFSFWNKTLSMAEVTELYNSGLGLQYPFSSPPSGSTDIDFTITDDWNGSSILEFSVNITWSNTTQETYSTTNGTVSLTDVGNPGSLDVTYWNMTDYFDRSLSGEIITENATNTITTTTFQAYVCFDGQAVVSNASLTPDNFTIGSTVSSSCFNLTAGDHNVLAQLSGWYNKNQTFTISALENSTRTVVNMSYANLTVSAIDGTTNESLSGYNLTIESLNYSWSEITGSVTNHSFYLINGTYNITIDHPDYATTTAQANVTVEGHTNYSFTLYKSNSVRIYIFDEITDAPILENITIRWTSNTTTWENVTGTGELFVSNITAGEYELLFYSGNYSTRSYTITVGERSTQVLNAYMINTEYSTIFTIKDIDTGVVLEDVSITMYKQINSTWTTVESKTSDISGKAQFYYDPIAHYKFFLARSDYEDYVFFLNPILFSTYEVFMTKTTVLNYSVDFDDISIIYAPAVFYNNENSSFNYLISSPAGTLTDYSITLTYPGGSSTASGVNAIGEQLSAWVNISGATSFDSVTLEYNYTTTLSGERSFKAYLPIVVNETGGTWLQNKNTTYGLGLFERLLIVTIIVLFAVGIAVMVGQIVPGLVIGLFLFGFMVFIGFVPIWAILPSMLVGVLFVIWKSGGA